MSLIRDNRLEHDITLLLTKTTNYTSENILLGTLEITTQADMVMCNPPFFDADLP